MIKSIVNTSNFDVCSVLHELIKKSHASDKNIFKNTLLVGMQHILNTTVDMLSVMKECGLTEAVVGGKKYSTHLGSAKQIEELGFTYVPDGHQLGYGRFDDCMQEVVHRIWFKALEKINTNKFELMIILDDGADLLRATPGIFFNWINSLGVANKPEMIIGIEQTRGGTNHPLFNGLPFPIIDVAGSFAKTQIEYPKVSEIIADRVALLIDEITMKEICAKPVIGVIGYGTMGKAISREFIKKGFKVIVYDKNSFKQDNITGVIHYDDSAILIANSDIIMGCTGEDITSIKSNLSALLYSRQKKWLISAGSKDHEFNTLLRIIQNEIKGLGYVPDPLNTTQYENHAGAILEIIRGGFPINFTNEAHSVSPEHIWPTRAALLLACISAINIRRNNSKKFMHHVNTFMLSPQAQLLIIRKYFELNPRNKTLRQLSKLTNKAMLDFLIKNSDGARLHLNSEELKDKT